MIALALAFASDSGQHARQIGNAMMGMTAVVILVAPSLGALAGSGIAALFARRRAGADAEGPNRA
jgi:hypothetical protein